MSVIAAAVVTSAVGSAYSSYKGAKAQGDAVDAQRDAADQQNDLARDQFAWNKKVYEEDTRPAAKADAALRTRLADDMLQTSSEQRDFARDQREYYEDTFQPVERQVVTDAMDYDSADKVASRADRAGAEVSQQFANARGQNWRGLARMGINPNSGAFAAMGQRSVTDQALGTAQAKNNSRQTSEDKAIALRAGAANFGRNMPNTSSNFYAGSVNSGSAAGAQSGAGLAGTLASNIPMNNAYQSYFNNTGAAANRLADSYGMAANGWNNAAAGLGGLTGGLIQGAGGLGGVGGLFGFGGGGVQGLPSGADASLFW